MTVIVEGIGDLQKAFAQHKQQIELKTVRRMVASGAGVLRTEAKKIARQKGLKKTGAMIRNIAIKRERRTPPGVTQYNVGVRHGRDLGKRHTKFLAFSKRKGRVVIRRKDDPFYYRFIELGHNVVARSSGQEGTGKTRFKVRLKSGNEHFRTRKFRYDSITGRRKNPTGFVKAYPFLAPALRNKRAQAIAAMEQKMQQELAKANRTVTA